MRRVLAAALLLLLAALAVALLQHLPPTTAGDQPEGLIVLAASWLAAALAAYLLLCAAVAAAGRLLARSADRPLRVLAGTPRPLRRLLATVLGATVVVAAGGPPASADEPRPHRPAPQLAWPLPTMGSAPVPPATADAGPEPDAVVVVGPGDSLWSIAAAALGPAAGPADVAAAWPRWWRANRDVIGSDPTLIRPGQQLVAPTGSSPLDTRSPR